MLAVSYIVCSQERNFIIFSDSISSLEAISRFKIELDLVQKIVLDYTHLTKSGKTVVMCWIPSHVLSLIHI